MPTNFPTSLDTLTNPTAGDYVSVIDHAGQHSDANDAIESLEAKVGINGSLVTSSLDYLIKNASSNNPGHRHTTAHITASTDKNFVTDAQLVTIQNTYIDKSPVFTYTDGLISRIDYYSGNYKLFYYSGSQLTQLEYVLDDKTITKDFTYNIDGTIASINQTEA